MEIRAVKCSGLPWVSVMLLTHIGWANRIWALPFLPALASSERYYADKPRTHKPLTDRARQLLLPVKRWIGERQVVAVGDRSYAVIDLLSGLQGRVSLISRLRLDAAPDEPAPTRVVGQRGRSGLKGNRLPTLAKLATDSTTRWPELTLSNWYGGQSQIVDYCGATAL